MSDITANVVVSMPSQLFTMARSFKAVANGKIYIGKIDTDPVNPENQIQVYVENEDGSHVPVSQPIIINAAGYPVYNGQIAKFVTVQGHSMAVYDAYGAQQFYFPNVLKYDPDQFRAIIESEYGAGYVGFNPDISYPSGSIGDILKRKPFIQISDFGVVGVGDETEKLRLAHKKANTLGIPVLYDVSEITMDANANIEVRTSIDFNGCVIRPQFSGVPSYDTTPTYSLQGNARETVTSKIYQIGMRKGEMALYGDMTSYSRGTFWMDTRDPLCKRSIAEATPTYYKTTINRVTKYGGLQYPLEHDFTASSSPEAYFRPDEDFWLKVEGAHIDTSGMTSGVVFKALRSQVKFSDITVRQDDNVKMTNIRQIFYLGDGVSQIRFNDISAEAMSSYNSTYGTYLLGSNYAAEIILDNVIAVQGWGALGLHKSRDLTVTNSTLNRVDGHYHIFDIDVNHTKLHEFGVHIGVGGGYLRVTNCTKYLGIQTDLTGTSANAIDKTRRSVIFMREDYGSYFDGDITVDNVVYKMSRELSFASASEEWPGILSCVSFNAGVSTTSSTTPDYGYTAPVPWGTTVTVKNITVEVFRDAILDSWLTFAAVNYNGNYILPSVLMPASITVKDIKYSKPPRTAKIAPVILPDLRGTTAAVASGNNRAFFNSIINIENIHSGFAKDRQIGALNTGVQTLMCMYTQTEISNFPTPSVVPEINVRNFYGFSGKFDIPGRLSLTDCFVISLTDSSGGRNSDSFIKVSGGFVYALPSSSGGSSSQLPRAEWNSVRFIKSPVSPDLTDYDSIQGCTFENGKTPIGVSASVAFTGSVGDAANRLQ
ncbi:phage head-binding domain-containing protein [Escherichia coli]|uniref:phage head-binding domain-containing protein n=1 Tax=Escherichia coli TaxID=562 RepID=UPI003348DCAA